jgi:hypothetical protein
MNIDEFRAKYRHRDITKPGRIVTITGMRPNKKASDGPSRPEAPVTPPSARDADKAK